VSHSDTDIISCLLAAAYLPKISAAEKKIRPLFENSIFNTILSK
jgi:hypothetical protein